MAVSSVRVLGPRSSCLLVLRGFLSSRLPSPMPTPRQRMATASPGLVGLGGFTPPRFDFHSPLTSQFALIELGIHMLVKDPALFSVFKDVRIFPSWKRLGE